MTKHGITNLIFAIALLGFIAVHCFYPVSIGWYILLGLLYLAVIGIGSYFIELDFFTHSYSHGDRNKPRIAITFDDGPNGDTAAVLDILRAEKTSATFFCIGRNAVFRSELVKRIDAEGHLIGTHSFHHHWRFPLQGKDTIADEIRQSQEPARTVIGKKPLLFRPPFGVTDPPVASAIKATGVSSIGWSVRSYDTVISSPEKLLQRISHIQNGDIILFHEAGLQTKAILPQFIKNVRSQGFEIVPLTALLGLQAYEI